MGGGSSKKYQNITCHCCDATATEKLFLNSTYVPACDECSKNSKNKQSSIKTQFQPTSFVDEVSYADTNEAENDHRSIIANYLKGDFIALIGPRRSTTSTNFTKSSSTRTKVNSTINVSNNFKVSNIPKPKPVPPRQRQVETQLLVPTPVLEEVVFQETKSDIDDYQPQFLFPGANAVQEEVKQSDPRGAAEEYYGDYGYGEYGKFGEYQEPYEEPLSWRWTPQEQKLSQQRQQQDMGSMSVGQRHCRYNRCPCSVFSNDSNNPTICSICSHGEMYHRSKMEAPLARQNIPGSGHCYHCKLLIVGGGFSGYYKESKDGHIVHDECWQLYRESTAPTCKQCNAIILKNHKGFSGRYSKVSFGDGPKVKVHKECLQIYLECQRGDEY